MSFGDDTLASDTLRGKGLQLCSKKTKNGEWKSFLVLPDAHQEMQLAVCGACAPRALHCTCSMQATRLACAKQYACILLTERESFVDLPYGMHLLVMLGEHGVTWADRQNDCAYPGARHSVCSDKILFYSGLFCVHKGLCSACWRLSGQGVGSCSLLGRAVFQELLLL